MKKNMASGILVITLFLLHISSVSAKKFYVDPMVGSMDNDGSYASPWSTLEEVFENDLIETQSWNPLPYTPGESILVPKNAGAPVHAGDTLVLRSGLHGNVFIRGATNAKDIVIIAEEGHTPILADIQLSAAKHWQLIGLTFDASAYQFDTRGTFIFVEDHGWHGPSGNILIRGCTLRSIPDATGWTIDDWNQNAISGILIEGNQSIVENNTLININFGISISGDTSRVYGNQIINFSGDGIRPQGSFINVESNTIKNCYAVNANHDDGIQSFNLYGDRFEYNTIRGNTIINYEDINQPFRGSLQGIGCFDGPYRNWTIENNLIVVDHWHGISLYGAYDCKVINNTVIDPTPEDTPGPAWILITDHKDGTPSERCVVYNNLAGQINVDSIESNNLVVDTYSDYDQYFRDYKAGDFRLRPNSPAIDGGRNDVAPAVDILGTTRPQGQYVDVGAYEFVDTTTTAILSGKSTGWKLFPNPVHRELYLSGDISLPLYILDATGRIILIVKEVKGRQDVVKIPVSGLAEGIYFIQSTNGKAALFLKI